MALLRRSVRLPAFGPAHMVVAITLVLLALFSYAALQTAAQTYRMNETRRALAAEVAELRTERDQLQGVLDYMSSDEYVEGFARDELGLVRPGEVLVEVEAPEEQRAPRRPDQRWWEALFGW